MEEIGNAISGLGVSAKRGNCGDQKLTTVADGHLRVSFDFGF
jgi:hypothetical protein